MLLYKKLLLITFGTSLVDRQKDVKKLTVNFRNFSKAPKNLCLQGQQCDWLRTGRWGFDSRQRNGFSLRHYIT